MRRVVGGEDTERVRKDLSSRHNHRHYSLTDRVITMTCFSSAIAHTMSGASPHESPPRSRSTLALFRPTHGLTRPDLRVARRAGCLGPFLWPVVKLITQRPASSPGASLGPARSGTGTARRRCAASSMSCCAFSGSIVNPIAEHVGALGTTSRCCPQAAPDFRRTRPAGSSDVVISPTTTPSSRRAVRRQVARLVHTAQYSSTALRDGQGSLLIARRIVPRPPRAGRGRPPGCRPGPACWSRSARSDRRH